MHPDNSPDSTGNTNEDIGSTVEAKQTNAITSDQMNNPELTPLTTPESNTEGFPNNQQITNEQVTQPTAAAPQQPIPSTTSYPTIPKTSIQHPAPTHLESNQQPLYGGVPYGPSQPRGKNPSKKRRLVFAGASILLILLLGTAFVFGYYIPNKPENVWNTGLNRTGKVATKLVQESTQPEKLEKIKKSELQANIDADWYGEKFSGSLNAKYDPTKGSYNFIYSSQEGEELEQKITADIVSNLADKERFPDTFIKINGLTSLGLDQYFPALTEFEGKWISISSDYIEKSLGDGYDGQTEELSNQDYVEFATAITSVTSEYILTSDPAKAVLERKNIVGKEKVDDINTYHYIAGINKQHAKDYCKALTDTISETQAFKKIVGNNEENLKSTKEYLLDECNYSVDEIKDDETFDLWIDRKYKLIHKVRFTEKSRDEYIEIGQTYKGDEEVTIFVKYHNDEDKLDGKLTIVINTNTSSATGTLDIEGGEGDDKYKIKVTITSEPYDGEINSNEPSESIPVEEVLKKLGFAEYLDDTNSSFESSNSDDSERQSDINAIHAQLEAFFAMNGYYPSLENVNNPDWIKQNLPGLDLEALKDPAGDDPMLESTHSSFNYGYKVEGCEDNKDQCSLYILSALLDSGDIYEKMSLN